MTIEKPTSREIVAIFAPDAELLLDVLRRRVDDSMLREIAEADYKTDVAAHLKALRAIRDDREIRVPMKWVPKEVLELIRWSEPEDPTWKPGASGARGHVMRAFACAVLLRAAGDPESASFFDGENQSVAQLVSSALSLDREVVDATASLLAWRMERLDVCEERAFFAFALLMIAVLSGDDRFPEGVLSRLADWVLAEEEAARAGLEGVLPENGDEWLLGLTWHGLRHEVWRAWGRRLLIESTKTASDELSAKLKDIGNRLIAGSAQGA